MMPGRTLGYPVSPRSPVAVHLETTLIQASQFLMREGSGRTTAQKKVVMSLTSFKRLPALRTITLYSGSRNNRTNGLTHSPPTTPMSTLVKPKKTKVEPFDWQVLSAREMWVPDADAIRALDSPTIIDGMLREGEVVSLIG